MKTFYVELETTEGNRVGKIVNVTEEDVNFFMPLIQAIMAFKPYELKNSRTYSVSNFPTGNAVRIELGEKTVEQLYPDIVPDIIREFVETFKIFSGYDADIHRICCIREFIETFKIFSGYDVDIHRICCIQEVIFGRTLIVEE